MSIRFVCTKDSKCKTNSLPTVLTLSIFSITSTRSSTMGTIAAPRPACVRWRQEAKGEI